MLSNFSASLESIVGQKQKNLSALLMNFFFMPPGLRKIDECHCLLKLIQNSRWMDPLHNNISPQKCSWWARPLKTRLVISRQLNSKSMSFSVSYATHCFMTSLSKMFIDLFYWFFNSSKHTYYWPNYNWLSTKIVLYF